MSSSDDAVHVLKPVQSNLSVTSDFDKDTEITSSESSVKTLILEDTGKDDLLKTPSSPINPSSSQVLLLILSLFFVADTVMSPSKKTSTGLDSSLSSNSWSLTLFLLLSAERIISEYKGLDDISFAMLFSPIKFGFLGGSVIILENFSKKRDDLYISIINLLTYDSPKPKTLVFIITFLYWGSMLVYFMILVRSQIPPGFRNAIFDGIIIYFSW